MTLEGEAVAAGLHYVDDDIPGIRRRRVGRTFRYLAPDGTRLTDPELIARIKALAIPPAWSDVWISPDPAAHIQATGRDARRRKQYRYHPHWREVRDAAKYDHLATFGEVLPRIRAHVEQDLRLRGLPREKVLATVVKLLEETSIRIGNEEYRRQNRSFGLTTMLGRHAHASGNTVRFEFKGKSGRQHRVELTDRRLARIVKQCQEVPGQELFQYVDELGQRHSIGSADVNEYLREASGGDCSAKDFRTWNGTLLAMRYLSALPVPGSMAVGRRSVSSAIRNVAADLGNTPAVCRKAYVHPLVVSAFLEGWLDPEVRPADNQPSAGLTEEERCLLRLLSGAACESVAA